MLTFLEKVNDALKGWRKIIVLAITILVTNLSSADPNVKVAIDGIVGTIFIAAQAYQNTNISKL